MARLVFEYSNGDRREVEATAGLSVMQTAVENGVEGIVAECGGSASCATCHVYLVSGDFEPMTNQEDEMLDFVAADRRAESRLSCQLIASEGDEPLLVRIPSRQL